MVYMFCKILDQFCILLLLMHNKIHFAFALLCFALIYFKTKFAELVQKLSKILKAAKIISYRVLKVK